MSVYFVGSSLSFIPALWKDDGTYTESSWPTDAVILDEHNENEYWRAQPPEGKTLGVDAKGYPCWVDATSPDLTYAEELANLNYSYSNERLSLCSAWLVAAVADGVNEVARKSDVEAELRDLDDKNASDVAALKKKYGVKK